MTETELAEIPQPRVGKALNSNWVVSRRWSPRSAWLGVAGLAVPTGAYFWFIHQYAVNVIYWDQWSDVSLLDHLYAGSLGLGDLWAGHGDHRILFPNLIVLVLALSTHFNVIFEEYLSGAMLAAATGFFIEAHRRRSPATPLIKYCPVAFLLLSFVQFQNTLWGFQMAWYLVTLALAVTLFLLDRPLVTRFVFAAAVVAAVVGSFSSLQGLLIWPVGLLVIYVRRRPRSLLVIWIVCASITTALYFFRLHAGAYSDQTYVFSHPLQSFQFFLFLIGSVVGVQLTNHPWPVILFGAIILAIAIWVVVSYRGRDEQNSSLIGVALTCYGVLFGAAITQGRASFALWAPSRYSTCGLLVLAGCYLALLGRAPDRAQQGSRSSRQADGEQRLGRHDAHGRTVPWAILTPAILITVVLGTAHGVASAESWSEAQRVAADITVNIDKASNTLVQYGMVKYDPQHTRQSVETMKAHHLSLFATSAAKGYQRQGLFRELTALHTDIRIPKNGEILKGTFALDAVAIDQSGVTKVEFRALGVGRDRSAVVATGKPTLYGWIASWDTTTTANGSYRLQSIAYGYGGSESDSTAVTVTVRNDT